MDPYAFALIVILAALVAYVITLYHRAHGNERKATENGARIVLEALERDGRITPKRIASEDQPPKVGNIGEEEFNLDEVEVEGLPSVIVARNEKHAKQIGERVLDDLVKHAEGRK